MRKLFEQLHKRERLLAALCVLFGMGRCGLELMLPGYLNDLVRLVQQGSDPIMVWMTGRTMLLCVLGSIALAIPAGWCAAQASAGFAYSLREAVFRKATELDKAQVQAFSVSGLTDCTTEAVNDLQAFTEQGLLALIRAAGVVFFAAIRLPQVWIELGGYVFFAVLALAEVAWVLRQLAKVRLAAGKILAVLNAEPSVQPGTKTQGGETGTLEFRHVSFCYPDTNRCAVENVSFRVKKGQKVAIVGASGCGKSTLSDLAARLYDPEGGQILLNGIDLREYSFEALYDRLSYAPQTPAVFSGSVRANVFFGESEAPNREKNLKAVWKGIPGESLPDKVEGAEECLSDGQKQRLGIARVLARKPQLVILDDCFSALDIQACRKLLDSLQGITVLLTTGQPDLAKMADCILVLEQGRLVAQGAHAQLLETCPAYGKWMLDGSGSEVRT